MPGRKNKGRADSGLFPFHNLIRSNFTSGSYPITISPNSTLTPRGLVEADTWAYFRVKSLAFRLHPTQTAADSDAAAGYLGDIPDNFPGAINQLMEVIPSCFLGGDATVPTEWVHVRKSELQGAFPWYRTIPSSADPTEEAPGIITVAGNAAEAFNLEVRGVFEFKTALATSNTPDAVNLRIKAHQERVALAREKERGLLLKLLASATPSAK